MQTTTFAREPSISNGLRTTAEWASIYESRHALIVEQRILDAELVANATKLAKQAPFCRRADGEPEEATEALGELAMSIRQDISQLARRFAGLMNDETVRLRLEGVTTDACRKIHTDYTDLRLITTYYGPATQVLHPNAADQSELWSMEPGDIGLFKGRLFAPDHAPCRHRSPPLADTGKARLVLVIDTPRFAREAEVA